MRLQKLLHLPLETMGLSKGIRLQRYLGLVISHSTSFKILNLLRVESEIRKKRSHLKGFPYVLKIESTNFCNLRCRICYETRKPHTFEGSRGYGNMTMEVFKRIIDEIGQYVYRVNLYGFGEPFLYDKTLNMVRYASDRNISVGITSNFNSINDDILEPIILSGLEHLVVSIDGIDQSSYQKYRVGGDFNRVINNLQKLQEIKKKMNKKFPILDWQFLVMKHNVPLRPQAEAIARELGMGMRYSCIGVDIQDESQRQEWLPEDEALSQYNYKTLRPKGIENLKTCSWLYRTVFINWDGGVSPCCNYYTGDKTHDFGNILEKTFAEIWNGHAYSVARKLVSRQILANDEQAKNNICRSCEKFF